MLHLVTRLTLFSLIGLLVVAPSLEDFGYWSDPFRQPTQQSPGAGNGAGDWKSVLEPGKPIKGELAGERQHTYQIRLSADQLLKAIVEQEGIDLVARVFGPDGKQILEIDADWRKHGQESVLLVAEEGGEYRLSVQPKLNGAPGGGYQIRIEELRAATERDRQLQEARKLSAESLILFRAGKYDEARPLAERALEIRGKELGPVSDKETRNLMAGYYGRLLKGEGRGEALRQMQLGMLKDAKLRHPYYWASFIQAGEWANLDGRR